MGKSIRILAAILVVLGFVLLGRNEAAWAADPGANPSSSQYTEQSFFPDKDRDKDKDCDKDKHKKKDKCDEDEDEGTVKPPDEDINVCEKGAYSVGGAATLDIKVLRKDNCVEADMRAADPAVDQLPSGAGAIRSDVLNLQLPPKTKVSTCFAVPPGEQVKIYSFSQGTWKAVKTKVKNGIACAEVSASGAYALVGK